MVGAFQSEDDGRCHAIRAQASGDIVDVTHDCQGGGLEQTLLAQLDGPVALSAHYARNDTFRHVIVGLNNGDLFDIRFKPGIAPAPIRLMNIRDFGPVKSLASWTDVQGRQNIAIVTTWLFDAQVVSLYQAIPGQPGAIHYLDLFPATDNIIDIAGEYVYWDNTNKIQIAVGAAGASSSMKMMSWRVDVTPNQSNFESRFEGTNTPWVTNFPGANPQTESIISMGGNIGYSTDYQPWATTLTLVFLDTANQIKMFSANSGGGRIAVGPFVVPPARLSRSQDHISPTCRMVRYPVSTSS